MSKTIITTIVVVVIISVIASLATEWLMSKTKFDDQPTGGGCGCGCGGGAQNLQQ